ncbi:MAG: family 10 glycosylhydrolase [Armatimonadetes bacterium]|nr:family 10 glycosylhydrolase [Armatimonadota bacterium]
MRPGVICISAWSSPPARFAPRIAPARHSGRARGVLAAFLLLTLVHAAGPQYAGAASRSRVPARALWIEVSANLQALSTREGVRRMLDRAKQAGVDVIIPEAKNAWSYASYPSDFLPRIGTSPVPRRDPPPYPPPREWYPQGYDQLQVLIEEAHVRGIQVHVAVNLFSEGLNTFRVGRAYDRPEWRALHYVVKDNEPRLVPSTEVGLFAFVNPNHPEVQLYEMAAILEVVRRYRVDGIVLDRARYPDVTADFSEVSRAAFERHLGRRVTRWPEDIFRYDRTSQGWTRMPGPLYRPWIAWRARTIQSFFASARRAVHHLKPGLAFAAYVGGWYPTYFDEGANWGSPGVPVRWRYPWASLEWEEAGIAPLVDYLMVGLYYPRIFPWEGRPGWASIIGGAALAQEMVTGTPVVGGVLLTLFRGQPERARRAFLMAARATRGVMYFDLVYVDLYGWWGLIGP